jgi:hypothetical protein
MGVSGKHDGGPVSADRHQLQHIQALLCHAADRFVPEIVPAQALYPSVSAGLPPSLPKPAIAEWKEAASLRKGRK